MSKYDIETSSDDNRIYIGKSENNGLCEKAKEDVTVKAIVAVAEHVVNAGKKGVEIRDENEFAMYTIKVTKHD